jgi:hypothetical protein
LFWDIFQNRITHFYFRKVSCYTLSSLSLCFSFSLIRSKFPTSTIGIITRLKKCLPNQVEKWACQWLFEFCPKVGVPNINVRFANQKPTKRCFTKIKSFSKTWVLQEPYYTFNQIHGVELMITTLALPNYTAFKSRR